MPTSKHFKISVILLFCGLGYAVYLLKDLMETKELQYILYPNSEKRVENTMRSRVFLMKFEVFG